MKLLRIWVVCPLYGTAVLKGLKRCTSTCVVVTSSLKNLGLRPVLMQSETWIEKAGFRSETKNGFLMQLKKRLFNPRFSIVFFNRNRQSKALEIFDPTRQSDSCIGDVESPTAIRVSHTHATTTRRHTTTPAMLAWLPSLLLLLSASQRDKS